MISAVIVVTGVMLYAKGAEAAHKETDGPDSKHRASSGHV